MAAVSDTTPEAGTEKSCTVAPPTLPPYQPPQDPLLTPIHVPNDLLSPQTVNPHTVSSRSSPLAVEEALSSGFVHASCRIYEASNVVTAVCNRIIHQWSGLGPKEAAAETALAIASGIGDNEKYTGYGIPVEAAVLKTMLSAMQLQTAVAGTAAGIVMDARKFAVSHGKLCPLSAFPQADSSSGRTKDSSPTTKTTAATAATAAAATFATFSAFTGGATAEMDLQRLERAQQESSSSVSHFASNFTDSHVCGRGGEMSAFECCTRGTLERLYNHKSYASSMKQSNYATARNMRVFLESTMYDICNAIDIIEILLSRALRIVRLKSKRAESARKGWHMPALVFGRKTKKIEKISDEDLIELAYSACRQAVLATNTVKGRLSYSVLQTTTGKTGS